MNSTPLRKLLAASAALIALAATSRAVDFHVTTAQELQNALTLAAANGADDAIYLAAGYYTGNFNFNSTENRSLRIEGEPGTTSTDIAVDGAGTGRSMSLSSAGTGDLTVRGITFLRNCGDVGNPALRLAASTVNSLWVEACRFLSPTNASAKGLGLEIVSGQNVTLTNCVVIGRGNAGGGVVIASVPGTVSIGGCAFSSNEGAYGPPTPAGYVGVGGVYIFGAGALDVVGNTFTGNGGDGIYSGSSGATSSRVVTFVRNTVSGNGGNYYASYLRGSAFVVTDNIFRNNAPLRATLYLDGDGAVLLSNNVFEANRSRGVAAYLSVGQGALTATDNSFIGNVAADQYSDGGGMYVTQSRG